MDFLIDACLLPFLILISFRASPEDFIMDQDLKREVEGKRLVCDKCTGKHKHIDLYDRSDAPKKKVADEKLRAMLSSNVEQSIIPADLSKLPLVIKFLRAQN
jgi:hypothetical protein